MAESIIMVGAGNVASWLAVSLHRAGHRIKMVYSRTSGRASDLASRVNARWTCTFDDIGPDEGIWIFALTDQATAEIAGKTGYKKAMILHTAGSLSLNTFSGHADNYGVIYPLQTFSGNELPGSPEVPLCIESNSPEGLVRLRSLAETISSQVYELDSERRSMLHTGAVFACNFSNHMYSIASELIRESGVPFEIYHSLIRETADKAIRLGPLKSQTGPASRNDRIIIKKHLDLLSFSPQLMSIYGELTESIRQMAGLPVKGNDTFKSGNMGNFKEDLGKVKAFAFDVDGVFSDGSLLLSPDGELIRSMNIKDGFAMQLAVRKGYPVAIITGGNSESVRKRFVTLGVHDVYMKSSRKLDDFYDFCKKYSLDPSEILYMGDDIPDYPVMQKAGFPTCPLDAVPEIKQVARYVSDRRGGHGCVRDVIEQVLRVHGFWMEADTFIL